MSYCPECKQPLTSYTGNFRWCEVCGYTTILKEHPAISEFEGARLRDLVMALSLENKAFKQDLTAFCKDYIEKTKLSTALHEICTANFVRSLLEKFCGGN